MMLGHSLGGRPLEGAHLDSGRDTALVIRLLSGHVARHQVSICWNMVGEQVTQALNVIPPVTMQLADHSEPIQQLRSSICHPCPCRLTDRFIEGPGRIRDDKHVVSCLQRRERGEGDAHVGDHAGNNELSAPGRLYSLDEVFIIPGINLARASTLFLNSPGG